MGKKKRKKDAAAGHLKNDNPVTIEVESDLMIRRLVIALVAIEIAFVILDAIITYGELTDIVYIQNIFDITREGSMPSWFGTTQMFMVGLTIWSIVVLNKKRLISKGRKIGWAVIATFITYLSLDDGAQIHERIGSAYVIIFEETTSPALISTMGGRFFDHYPSYAWQFAVAPIFIILGFFMLFFLWKEFQDGVGKKLLIAGVALFAIAQGMDFIEGLEPDHALNIFTWVQWQLSLGDSTVIHFAKSLEEFLEMLGTTVLWVAFLRHFIILTRNKLIISFSSN